MENNLPPSDSPPPSLASSPPPSPPPPLAQTPPPILTAPVILQPVKKGRGWKIFALVLTVLLVVSFASNVRHFTQGVLRGKGGPARMSKSRLEEVTIAWAETQSTDNKIAVIPMEGIIMSEGLGDDNLVNFVKDEFKSAAND